MAEVSFSDIREEFMERVKDAVWRTFATVDRQGRRTPATTSRFTQTAGRSGRRSSSASGTCTRVRLHPSVTIPVCSSRPWRTRRPLEHLAKGGGALVWHS